MPCGRPEPIQLVVFSPASPLRRPGRLLFSMVRDLLASRELAWRLAVRDISAQYRQAALGFLWAIILPLANTLIWLFLNGSGLVSVDATALPYPVYVLTGTVLWSIFMDAVSAPVQVTTAAKSMLAKINFPREALIISGIYQTAFNALIKAFLMFFALLFIGVHPGWSLLLAPIGFVSLILAGTVLGLLLTPIGLLYSDIGKSLPLLLQFLMFLSPVVFPLPEDGWGATVVRMNPLTQLILTARDWLTGLAPQSLDSFLMINVCLLVMLVFVWIIYRLAMPILVERMSA